MFCKNCGNQIDNKAVICVKCGVGTSKGSPKSRVAYVLLGLFLGGLGIHNFYAGYTGKAVAQLLITLFLGCLVIPLIAVWIWVIIEICVVTTDSKGMSFC